MTDYYVTSGPDGYNSNNGLGPTGPTAIAASGATGPWQTIQRGATGVTGGDTLYLVTHQAGAEFTNEHTEPQFLRANNSESAIISIFGANASGEVDGTLAVIDGTNHGASGPNPDGFHIREKYHLIMNVHIKGNGGITNAVEATAGSTRKNALIFINIIADTPSNNGWVIAGADNGACINCISRNNVSGIGFDIPILSYNCLAAGGTGTCFNNVSEAVNCIARHGTAHGFGNSHMLVNSTFFNNANEGANFQAISGVAVNCLCSDNATGIRGQNSQAVAKTHAILKTAFNNDNDIYIRESIDEVTLSGDPFVRSGPTGITSDLSLSRTSNGELCKDVGWPTVWQIGATGGAVGPTAENGYIEIPNYDDLGASYTKKPADIRIGVG